MTSSALTPSKYAPPKIVRQYYRQQDGPYRSALTRRSDTDVLALGVPGLGVVIVDETEVKDDLVKDMIEVLTSFCTRLYGRRSAKNKARKAFEALEKAD